MRVAAVIPAYNVQDTVKKVVEGVKDLVDEVIVVNDASSDKTAHILASLGVTVIRHKKNMGLGGALRDGFKEALRRGCDIVITLDSDGQHDPSDLKRLLERLKTNQVDVIIGSRLVNHSDRSNFPRHRLYGNRILTWLTNLVIGRKVTTDSQSGYRVLKKEVLEQANLTGKRMEIASEIVYEAAARGFKIDEVAIKPTYDKEKSNVNLIADTFRILLLLARKRLVRRKTYGRT